MRKRFTVLLVSFLGVSTILVYLSIGYFLFQKGLLFPEIKASPATCTVDDSLRVNGTGIGINADPVENALDKILNIQTSADWPRIVLESTFTPGPTEWGKAELNLWARDRGGNTEEAAFYHTVDWGVGIWTSYNGGGHRFVILPNGNIGIGTTEPKAKLEVSGNAGVLNLVGSDHVYIQWYPDGIAAGRKGWMGWSSATDNDFRIHNFIDGGDILLTPTNGNVGIGTTNPRAKLDVNGNIRVGSSSTTCNADHVGELRYYTTCVGVGWRASRLSICMQKASSGYGWYTIQQSAQWGDPTCGGGV